jgi:hypothetical protein
MSTDPAAVLHRLTEPVDATGRPLGTEAFLAGLAG